MSAIVFIEMIFTTFWFVAAAALFFPLYLAIPFPMIRKYLLLVFCLIFHAHFAGAAGVLPVIIVGMLVYICGFSRNIIALRFAMTVSVAALIWYKYTFFLAGQVLGLFDAQHAEMLSSWAKQELPVSPPLAISFFTFEFVHYLYDVSHGKEPIRGIVDFWSFTLFFPTLVAGPIKRYEGFLPSLREGLKGVTSEDLAQGLVRIAIGFLKKVVIADNLTSFIEAAHVQYFEASIARRWLFLVFVALRILMDFSGYSDIAIGLARLMGIRIGENFNWPYLATSIQSFWQRWHISLSTWIRDYVYIPMGGNRRGKVRTAMNGILAFGLCGLWHGPTWNFAFWGLYHGFGLFLSSNYHILLGPPGRAIKSALRSCRPLAWSVTMLFVFFGWLYFFYPFSEATKMIELLVVSKI